MTLGHSYSYLNRIVHPFLTVAFIINRAIQLMRPYRDRDRPLPVINGNVQSRLRVLLLSGDKAFVRSAGAARAGAGLRGDARSGSGIWHGQLTPLIGSRAEFAGK
ncbi:unnamed protein product, partial [Iphiclides podalirius]